MPMTRTTISFTREGMELIKDAARRNGSSVSEFVREAALIRARITSDPDPFSSVEALAHHLTVIGDQARELACQARRAG